MINLREEILNYAEFKCIKVSESARKKSVVKINQKTNQKLNYNQKLGFLKQNLTKDMQYYSKSLKAMKGLQINEIKQHIKGKDKSIKEQLMEMREDIKIEEKSLVKKQKELAQKIQKYEELTKNDGLFDHSFQNNIGA